jgi:hypothetical protein
MQADAAEDDGRTARRDRTGLGAGALAGGALGLALASVVCGPSGLAGSAIGALLGMLAGAIVGRSVTRQVVVDDWEPEGSPRSYVGVHSPDEDEDEDDARPDI